jgi:fibronectin type 3 domain-containing protein
MMKTWTRNLAGFMLALALLETASCNRGHHHHGASGPPAPKDLVATPADGMISLAWDASPGAETYSVKRSLKLHGPFTTVATGITATSYADLPLTEWRTTYYVVSASNHVGEGPDSGEVSALPVPAGSAPLAPATLVASGVDSGIQLSWAASTGGASYDVLRSTVSGGPYVSILTSALQTMTTVDSGVTSGTTYFYVVTASNLVGTSPDSAEASGMPLAPAAAPVSPEQLTAQPGDTEIMLHWNGTPVATTYTVERGLTSGGPYSVVTTTSLLGLVDSGLSNGTSYFYVVIAGNSAGQSAASKEVQATPVAGTTLPEVPRNLSATPGNGEIWISWDPSPGAFGYGVYRSTTTGGPYTSVASVVSPVFTENALTNGTTYYYVVTAKNSAGESGFSTEVSATPLPAFPPPGNLQAHPGDTVVYLGWDGVTGATSYNLKRSLTSGGPYDQTATVAVPPTAAAPYQDTGLTDGTTYYYVVSAENSDGESLNSVEVSATPQKAPPGCGCTGWEALLIVAGALVVRRGRKGVTGKG